jgi:hypothetical protein
MENVVEKKHLVVTVDGGLIQCIVSNDPAFFKENVEITVVDFDVEGAEVGSYETINTGGDDATPACVSSWEVESSTMLVPVQIIKERDVI